METILDPEQSTCENVTALTNAVGADVYLDIPEHKPDKHSGVG